MEKFFSQPALKTKITSESVMLREMLLGYYLAPLCAMLANSVFSTYLTRYYADVIGLTDSRFGLFSVMLPILSTIAVAAGNLFVGRLIDRTRTSAGKARPFLLLAAPVMAAAIILMFLTPGGENPQAGNYVIKMVWIAASFNLFYSAGYPCYYTAHSSMVALSTRNGKQRNTLATLSNASMVAAAGLGASILVPVLLQPFMFVTGSDGSIDRVASYANWRILGIAFAILTVSGITLEYFFTRERITEEARTIGVTEEKLPMLTHIKACISNKYWWMVILFILFFQMGQLVKNTSMSFYVRWMFDSVLVSSSPEASSGALMSTLGVIGGIPSAFGMIIAWFLVGRLDKRRSVILGFSFAVLGGLPVFLNVHSFGLICAGVALKAAGIIPAQYVTVAMLSDVLDHLEAKNGFRSDGFTMSVYGATIVVLAVFSMGIVNIFLGVLGYDASLPKQTASTEAGLVIAYLCMDMISFILSIILLLKMDVEKHIEEDKARILQRQKEAVLAKGETWIEPEERARVEQEKEDRKAEEARIAELKKRCGEKGLDFEEENRKYHEKQEMKKNSLFGRILAAFLS